MKTAARKSINDRINHRGKVTAEQIEANRITMLAASVGGWEWKGDLTFHGEKPEFQQQTLHELFKELPWVPAWMVAIQQGGQLKDQFGGIGPAARAVGGYVLGLINPLTLAAAALAALAIAAKQSEDQLFEFQKAQILSGQGAAVGAAGFLELASSIGHLQGVSRGGAVAALTETAKAGRYAGEQFEMVAAAAARMEASTGRSAQETIRAFESIAKEPVEGLLKLNDAERFLTEAQLQRIVALKEEGRMQHPNASAAASDADRVMWVGFLPQEGGPAADISPWNYKPRDQDHGRSDAVPNVFRRRTARCGRLPRVQGSN